MEKGQGSRGAGKGGDPNEGRRMQNGKEQRQGQRVKGEGGNVKEGSRKQNSGKVGVGSQRTVSQATTSGQDYEVALLCLVFLRSVRFATDFFLLSNHAVADKFDDIVLYYKLEGEKTYRGILVQAKHKEKTTNKKLSASNPFKLREYLDSFIKIRNNWEEPVEVDGCKVDITEVSLALYTNTGCTFLGTNTGNTIYNIANDVTADSDVKNLNDFIGAGGRLLRISYEQWQELLLKDGAVQESSDLDDGEETFDFLSRLTLCVEQLRDDEVDLHLEEELTKVLGLASPEIAKSLREELLKTVKGWWERRGESSCLTVESTEWKDILQKQVARINPDYTRKKLSFTQEALEAVRSVVANKQSWITVTDERQATATQLRLIQALGNTCFVLEAGKLSERFKDGTWEEVVKLWGTTACPTLAVDLSASSPWEFSDLLKSLISYVSSKDGRRLVVIAKEGSVDKTEFRAWSVLKAESTWSVLDPKTREELLAVTVKLQGYDVALHDVVCGDEVASRVMSDKVISALCDPTAGVTQLGVAVDSTSLENYIPQCLQRSFNKEINYEALQDKPILIFSKKFLFSITNNPRFQYLLLDQLESTNHIDQTTVVEGLCNESKMREECCRLGVRGVGEDDGLDRKGTEFVPFTWLWKDKVVVIEGAAGVGKSTFVTVMCSKVKEEFPKSWVLRFDLAKHTDFIKGRDFSVTSNVTTFLLRGLPRKQQQGLQRDLLEHSLYVTGNVFLFLDAFDEISPKFTDQCCHLLKGIISKVRFKQMIVTTRSINCKQVEDAVGRKAFSIPLFSKEEQVIFLETFSKNKMNNVDHGKISSLSQAAGPVLESPLLCRMAAEVLLYSDDLNLLRYKNPWIKVLLYKRFVKQTIINRPVEKLKLPKPPLMDTVTGYVFKEHLRRLKILAVKKLMPEEQLSNFDLHTELPDEKLGLVVSDGENADFQHQTFAEYFLGCWLVKNWEKCDRERLRELLLQKEFVMTSLSWLLFEKCELHKAVARGDVVKQLSTGTTDTGGFSALHVAAMTQGSQHMAEELLVSSGNDLHKQDKILEATPLMYAEIFRNWKFLEILIGNGKGMKGLKLLKDQVAAESALMAVVEEDLTGLFGLILRQHAGLVNIRYGVKADTHLHRAALCNSTNVLKHLIENYCSDVDVVNDVGETPLHVSTEFGHVATMRLLIRNKADTTKTYGYGWTALFRAAINGHEKAVELLLQSGADRNITDNQGTTPLMLAAGAGHLSTMELLIGKEQYQNIQNEYGWTALMLAAHEGQEKAAELLLQNGADRYIKDNKGNTPLILAARRGHLATVKVLIGEEQYQNIQNKSGCTSLTLAAQEGHEEVVELLSQHGADRNIKANEGSTPLIAASYGGHLPTVEMLLGEEQYRNIQNDNGATALMWAASEGHEKVVELLLRNGADRNIKDNKGNTPLILAATRGHLATVKLLIGEEQYQDIQNEYGWTALMLAADKGHEKVVELLLQNKADRNITDNQGTTPLMLAAGQGHLSTMELLIGEEEYQNKKNECGHTALVLAAHEGQEKAVKLLLQNGADRYLKDNEGNTPLILAATQGHLPTVTLLIGEEEYQNKQNEHGHTALMKAVCGGHEKVVELLLQNKADRNINDNKGKTALIFAASQGHLPTVELLIGDAHYQNVQNENGWRALLQAAYEGHEKVVELLLRNGADLNIKDNSVFTPLILASMRGHLSTVELLIGEEKYHNIQNLNVSMALMQAAYEGHEKVVELLLEKDVDVNTKDNDGDTPLTLAIEGGHLEVVRLLLEKGADHTISNGKGETALMIARRHKHLDVVELLKMFSERKKRKWLKLFC